MSSLPPADDPASDAALRYARGDEEALGEAFRLSAAAAYNQAWRMLGETAEAEDAVQDAFVRLLLTARKYQGAQPFAAWVAQTVHHACLKRLRAARRRRHHETRASERLPAVVVTDEVEPRREVPERKELAELVAILPERLRCVVDLHYFAELSIADIATTLDIGESAVKARLLRARRRLRDELARRGRPVGAGALLVALTAQPAWALPSTLQATLAELDTASPAAAATLAPSGSAMPAGLPLLSSSLVVGAFLVAAVVLAGVLLPLGGDPAAPGEPASSLPVAAPGYRSHLILDAPLRPGQTPQLYLPQAINEQSQIVLSSGDQRAARFDVTIDGGALIDLHAALPEAAETCSWARAIGPDGLCAGSWSRRATMAELFPCYWSADGRFHDLTAVIGRGECFAVDIQGWIYGRDLRDRPFAYAAATGSLHWLQRPDAGRLSLLLVGADGRFVYGHRGEAGTAYYLSDRAALAAGKCRRLEPPLPAGWRIDYFQIGAGERLLAARSPPQASLGQIEYGWFDLTDGWQPLALPAPAAECLIARASGAALLANGVSPDKRSDFWLWREHDWQPVVAIGGAGALSSLIVINASGVIAGSCLHDGQSLGCVLLPLPPEPAAARSPSAGPTQSLLTFLADRVRRSAPLPVLCGVH